MGHTIYKVYLVKVLLEEILYFVSCIGNLPTCSDKVKAMITKHGIDIFIEKSSKISTYTLV